MAYYQISGIVGFSVTGQPAAFIPKGTVFEGHVAERGTPYEGLVFPKRMGNEQFLGWRLQEEVSEIDEATYIAACEAGRGLAGEVNRLRGLGKSSSR